MRRFLDHLLLGSTGRKRLRQPWQHQTDLHPYPWGIRRLGGLWQHRGGLSSSGQPLRAALPSRFPLCLQRRHLRLLPVFADSWGAGHQEFHLHLQDVRGGPELLLLHRATAELQHRQQVQQSSGEVWSLVCSDNCQGYHHRFIIHYVRILLFLWSSKWIFFVF